MKLSPTNYKLKYEKEFWLRTSRPKILYQYFGAVCGELNEKLPSIGQNREKKRIIMNIGGNSTHGGKPGLSDSITLMEIVNEAREKAMHERIERMEKQMETLTAILHKLRNE